jgi:hypothetical protein
MAGRRGLRGRLDRLESDAHGTMATARGSMLSAVDILREFIAELEDGITLQVTVAGKKLPVEIRIVADEESAEPPKP